MSQPSRKKLVKTSSKASFAAESEEQPWATGHLEHGKKAVQQAAYERHVTEGDDTNSPPKHGVRITTTTTTATTTAPTKTAAAAAAAATAEETDAITALPPHEVYGSTWDGHSDVTRPARPPPRHTYSELFDLDDLELWERIRSPSGNYLSAEQAANRADRPMGIKERQEAIRRKVAEQSRQPMGNEITVVGDVRGKKGREKQERARKAKIKACFKCNCQ